MKVEELMIGDWVWVNDCEHLRPMQVAAIKRKSGQFYAECVDPNDATEHCECIVEKLVGVSINVGFVVDNGFEWDNKHLWWKKQIDVDAYIIWAEREFMKSSMVVASFAHRAVFYQEVIRVHHLQHALRMCRLDMKIKLR